MWNVIFRTVVIFFTVLFLMRLLGKRQLGELELSELIVSILVADAASVPLQAPDLSIWHGLVPVLILCSLEYLLAWATMKSVRLRALLCGRPCFLVVDGHVRQREMRRNRFTMDELAEELRGHDVGDLAQVRYAVLETDGTLNVVLRPEHRPATAGQLGCAAPDDGYGVLLVQQGRVMSRNLAYCGRDRAWLDAQLRRRGCARPEQVYCLILFESGKIYFERAEKQGTSNK